MDNVVVSEPSVGKLYITQERTLFVGLEDAGSFYRGNDQLPDHVVGQLNKDTPFMLIEKPAYLWNGLIGYHVCSTDGVGWFFTLNPNGVYPWKR